jgi:hypothetical protein
MRNLVVITMLVLSLNNVFANNKKEQGKAKEDYGTCVLACEHDFGKDFSYVEKMECITVCIEKYAD